MPEIKKVVFWQPIISPHYVPMLRELCQLYEEVVLVVVQEQWESRTKQGWVLPETGLIRIISLENADGYAVFEEEDTPHTIHVFSGTRGYAPIWRVLKLAIRKRSLCATVGETLDWRGVKGFLRFLISAFDALRIRSRLCFILAKGTLGVWWYGHVGYPQEKIFEWAYFVEESHEDMAPVCQDDVIRFIYVGRLSPEKGVVWLLDSFQKLVADNFELHLVGDGPLMAQCQQLAADIKHGKVLFHGQVPMSAIGSYYQGKDYLILPSTGKDGWGAVVNEAFQHGLLCIVSNNCGASSLLVNERLGRVINPQKRDSLFLTVKEIIQSGKKLKKKERDYVRDFSKSLSGNSGARYLKSIIEYTTQEGAGKPSPPWKIL